MVSLDLEAGFLHPVKQNPPKYEFSLKPKKNIRTLHQSDVIYHCSKLRLW